MINIKILFQEALHERTLKDNRLMEIIMEFDMIK